MSHAAVPWLALVACALWLAGCAPSLPPAGAGVEVDFLKGKQEFDDGHYLQAIQALEAFREAHPGSDRVDDAIFLLGQAHQKIGENLLARDEYDRLLRDFPQSDHREEAEYLRALSFLDEARGPALDAEPTHAALEAFRSYLRHFPDGIHKVEAEGYLRVALDRLAVKEWMNGKMYTQLRQPAAARIYFEKSLRILSDSSRAPDALMGLARANATLGEADKAKEAWQKLLDSLTPERVSREPRLRALLEEAERALGKAGEAKGRSS